MIKEWIENVVEFIMHIPAALASVFSVMVADFVICGLWFIGSIIFPLALIIALPYTAYVLFLKLPSVTWFALFGEYGAYDLDEGGEYIEGPFGAKFYVD